MFEVDLLLRAKWIFRLMGLQSQLKTEVALKDGKNSLCWNEKIPDHRQVKKLINMPSSALLPGFVNSHCHAASTLFRAQSEDGEGGRALYTVAFRGE